SNTTASSDLYTLSLHDALPIFPQAADWITKPELSTAHLDQEDRDLEYEKKVQLKPHIVYLANSSNVKVGVTRKTQVPTRWIDQRSEEHTSELQSRENLVCRLLL